MNGVRSALLARYESLVAEYPNQRGWIDRLEAVRGGDVLVEPGWMLRPILGDEVDTYGLYRVYPDGRIERDRFIERLELDRFRASAAAHVWPLDAREPPPA
jgi:hypothetical protein